MCVIESIAHVSRNGEDVSQHELPFSPDAFAQRLPGDEWHRVVQLPFADSGLEQWQDVRVLQAARDLDLALKAHRADGRRQLGPQHFDRDRLPIAEVLGQEDDRGAPAADLPLKGKLLAQRRGNAWEVRMRPGTFRRRHRSSLGGWRRGADCHLVSWWARSARAPNYRSQNPQEPDQLPSGQNQAGVTLAVAGDLPFHSGNGSSIRISTSWVSGGRITVAALVGMACVVGCPQPPPDDNTQIASIQIVPQIVTAVKGTSFQIRLRALNADHHLLPDSKAAQVTWTPGPGLTIPGSDKGASVIVEAPGTGTFPLTTELKAALGSVGDAATVTIIAPGPPGTPDWIVGDHTSSEPPLIVLADGRANEGSTTVWRGDTTIAVVGEGPLDQFRRDCNDANCGEVTMFSRRFALTSLAAQWTDACDLVAFTGAAVPKTCPSVVVSPPSPRVGVAMRTYIAASGGMPSRAVLQRELAKAREILADSRSGLEVNAAPEVVFPVTLVLDVIGPDWKCPMSGPNDVRQQLRSANISDTTFKASGITPRSTSIRYWSRPPSARGAPRRIAHTPVRGILPTEPLCSSPGSIE